MSVFFSRHISFDLEAGTLIGDPGLLGLGADAPTPTFTGVLGIKPRPSGLCSKHFS